MWFSGHLNKSDSSFKVPSDSVVIGKHSLTARTWWTEWNYWIIHHLQISQKFTMLDSDWWQQRNHWTVWQLDLWSKIVKDLCDLCPLSNFMGPHQLQMSGRINRFNRYIRWVSDQSCRNDLGSYLAPFSNIKTIEPNGPPYSFHVWIPKKPQKPNWPCSHKTI